MEAPGPSGEEIAHALTEELNELDAESALSVVSRWLAANKLEKAAQALATEVGAEPSKWGNDGPTLAVNPGAQLKKASPASPELVPVGEALPVPGTSTRPGRLFDTEPIDPASVSESLLTKPDPVFFGERDDKRREASATEEFPLTVRRASRCTRVADAPCCRPATGLPRLHALHARALEIRRRRAAAAAPSRRALLLRHRHLPAAHSSPPHLPPPRLISPHLAALLPALSSVPKVHFDALTSGLESETHFRVEEKQIIAGR